MFPVCAGIEKRLQSLERLEKMFPVCAGIERLRIQCLVQSSNVSLIQEN